MKKVYMVTVMDWMGKSVELVEDWYEACAMADMARSEGSVASIEETWTRK